MSIKENILKVQDRIAKSAKRSGRDPNQVQLVAVTKTVSTELILQAIENGIEIIGENRVQEANAKYGQIGPKVKWHLVGHLQTNKVKPALSIFEMIHSVDSLKLLEEIEKRATQLQKEPEALIQVNTSAETSKHGICPEDLPLLAKAASECRMTKVKGLMTISALSQDLKVVRACFSKLRRLSDEIIRMQLPNVEMKYLSMGMTSDFEVAIEEGANMVRIGSAIFGPREEAKD